MPQEKGKKETRLMKVTLDPDVFEKYDKGIIHSDKGLRNETGKLSALPDIAPISEDDLPRRKEIVYRDRYIQRPNPSLMQMLKQRAKYEAYYAITDFFHDMIYDPQKRASIWNKGKAVWNSAVEFVHSSDRVQESQQKVAETHTVKRQHQEEVLYEIETVNENNERIIVTGEQAELLVNAMRQKARELSSMIYLLSNIVVKDEKTEYEYILEDAYIKQLLSDEATKTIKELVTHRELLDEGTAICFDDWLNGCIRNGEKCLPIPVMTENSVNTEDNEGSTKG